MIGKIACELANASTSAKGGTIPGAMAGGGCCVLEWQALAVASDGRLNTMALFTVVADYRGGTYHQKVVETKFLAERGGFEPPIELLTL